MLKETQSSQQRYSKVQYSASLENMRKCLDQVEKVFQDSTKLNVKQRKRNMLMFYFGTGTTVASIIGFFKSLMNHHVFQAIIWFVLVFLIGTLTIKIAHHYRDWIDQQNLKQKHWLDEQFQQYPWFAAYYGMTQRLQKKEALSLEEPYEKKFVEATAQFLQLMDWLPYKIDRKTAVVTIKASIFDLIRGPLNDTMIFLVESNQQNWYVTSKATSDGNQRNYQKIEQK